jgi:hypothetical protein
MTFAVPIFNLRPPPLPEEPPGGGGAELAAFPDAQTFDPENLAIAGDRDHGFPPPVSRQFHIDE